LPPDFNSEYFLKLIRAIGAAALARCAQSNLKVQV